MTRSSIMIKYDLMVYGFMISTKILNESLTLNNIVFSVYNHFKSSFSKIIKSSYLKLYYLLLRKIMRCNNFSIISFSDVRYSRDEDRNNYAHSENWHSSRGGGGNREDRRFSRQIGFYVIGLHFRWRATHPDWRRKFLLLMCHSHPEIVELPKTFTLKEVRLACRKNETVELYSRSMLYEELFVKKDI